MGKAAWPTTSELTARLTGIGATLPGGYAAQDLIDSAVLAFEKMAGYQPFQASDTATAKTFDPTGNRYMTIPAAAQVTAIEIDGTALVANTDYWVALSTPITLIELDQAWVGSARAIEITAKWGYALTIPVDVWNAVLDYAVSLSLEAVQMASGRASGLAGPVTEIRQADITIKSGGGASFTANAAQKLTTVAKSYRVVQF